MAESTDTGGPRFVRNAALARYIGVSPMTIYRDPALDVPPALVIRGIEHNEVSKWEAWLRARAVSRVQKRAD